MNSFFYFCGHGGAAGGIGPLDHSVRGVRANEVRPNRVTAQDMYANMVKNIKEGCRLTAVFDTCHSGTMLNLKYTYGSSGAIRNENPTTPRRNPVSVGGQIINVATCSPDGSSYGCHFTVSLMGYLESYPKATFANALQHVIADLNRNKAIDKPEISSNQRLTAASGFFI